MKDNKQTEIKVGIVTIIAVVLFIVGLSLGNQIELSDDNAAVKMRFPNSGGIEKSEPVLVNGVKRGKVVSVESDDGAVLIKAEIDNIDDLKQDARAELGMQEITGGRKIELFPGTSEESLAPDQVIPGKTMPDLSDMVAMLGEMGGGAQTLIRRLDTLAAAMNKLIGDEKSYARLEKSIENLAKTSQRIDNFTANNLNDLRASINNLRYVSEKLKFSYDKYEPRADSISKKLDRTLDRASSTLKTAEVSLGEVETLLANLNSIAEKTDSGEGAIAKLLNDKRFAEKLDSSVTILHDFILQIKKHGVNINTRLGTRP